jgi:hypothetical protein
MALLAAAQGPSLLQPGALLGLLTRVVEDQGALLVAQRAEQAERVGARDPTESTKACGVHGHMHGPCSAGLLRAPGMTTRGRACMQPLTDTTRAVPCVVLRQEFERRLRDEQNREFEESLAADR